jgi:prepilin peptidase CpaA
MDIFLSLFLALCIAAWHDCKTRRIPNWLTVSTLLTGLLYHLLQSGLSGAGFSLLGVAAGFLLLFLPYALGVMGAGDVKLLMAAGAWTGAAVVLQAFMWTCILGGVLGLAVTVYNRNLRQTLKNILASVCGLLVNKRFYLDTSCSAAARVKLPYAVPIALGFLCYFLFGGLL